MHASCTYSGEYIFLIPTNEFVTSVQVLAVLCDQCKLGSLAQRLKWESQWQCHSWKKSDCKMKKQDNCWWICLSLTVHRAASSTPNIRKFAEWLFVELSYFENDVMATLTLIFERKEVAVVMSFPVSLAHSMTQSYHGGNFKGWNSSFCAIPFVTDNCNNGANAI